MPSWLCSPVYLPLGNGPEKALDLYLFTQKSLRHFYLL
jgi:hypothetical protein